MTMQWDYEVQGSPRPPSLLTRVANSQVSETTLKCGNSLEGFVELPGSCYNHIYGERIQIKISREKRYTGQSLGTFHMWSFWLSSSRGIRQNIPFLLQRCVTIHVDCQPLGKLS